MSNSLTATVRRGAAALALGTALALPSAQVFAAPPAADPSAAPAAAANDKDAAAVKKLLEQKFPGAQISHVAKTSYFGGLYEAMVEDKLVYTDKKADYVIVGSIYDTNTKTNLTDARQRKLNRVAIDKLPMDLSFKRVKGDGSRKLIIFSDADCPFCHRLEKEMEGLDNVTIYTFLFPIDQLHPDAANKSKKIWCAPDRQKAWDEFFASGKVPDNNGDCGDPVAQTQALGASLHISATPTLVFEDGSIQPGALPLAQIEQELNDASAEAKKLAASGAAQTK